MPATLLIHFGCCADFSDGRETVTVKSQNPMKSSSLSLMGLKDRDIYSSRSPAPWTRLCPSPRAKAHSAQRKLSSLRTVLTRIQL